MTASPPAENWGPVMGDFIQVARRYKLGTSPAHMALYCMIGGASETVVHEAMSTVGLTLDALRYAEAAEADRAARQPKRARFRILEGGRHGGVE